MLLRNVSTRRFCIMAQPIPHARMRDLGDAMQNYFSVADTSCLCVSFPLRSGLCQTFHGGCSL